MIKSVLEGIQFFVYYDFLYSCLNNPFYYWWGFGFPGATDAGARVSRPSPARARLAAASCRPATLAARRHSRRVWQWRISSVCSCMRIRAAVHAQKRHAFDRREPRCAVPARGAAGSYHQRHEVLVRLVGLVSNTYSSKNRT